MKLFKYFIYTALGGSLLTGCSKELDLKPTDGFTDANAFRTIADAQLAANGAYGRYGTNANTIYSTALVSDETKIGADNAGQGALTFRYQYSADGTTGGDVTAAYTGYYQMIDQVNRTLDKLPTVIATPAEEPRRNILKGQLLALRALAHFDLLQLYSKAYSANEKGIPIMLTSNIYAQPKRNTMGEVMTQIEKDMADAFALLPAVTPSTFSDTVMNQVNINAYRAKIALFKGDYQNAVTYATNVISSNVKPLASAADFPGIWTDANTTETLFRIRYSTGTTMGALWTTTGNLVYIAPSDKLIATYGTGDIRKAAYIGTYSGTTKNYVNKYFNSSKGGRVVDMKAIRIAEVYLIRAEAYAKLAVPDVNAGTNDLNEVRSKRITGYTNATFNNAGDLITAVLAERFKELCFEGTRLFDLKRNNLPVSRNASDVGSAAWQTLPAGNYRFVFPIPQYELLANPNNVQNDGY
ncbi:RagB/SusD family nutrient uptake outer membrane protein [Sediminibacterium ginsengisoli]|uniref:Starch-binding associating with outer membrane n=1 Tax=Sediminibacterium ginsengisoli TaxID=413434 RepID=A0A1T4NNV5_9BACT|nr:RagB/SusD family nutrient uptake outer membrane protein [Sediminibacterium ginsengisoli]SJZ81000.1 Starch-binding associating with outer membrane [Sediminibacterium ginsengisoli]